MGPAPFLLPLVVLVAPQDAGAQKDSKRVEAVVAELKSAFEKGQSPERIAAIEKAAPVADPAVVPWLAKGLKDADAAVQGAAIEALRYLKLPKALEALQDCAKVDKKLQKNAELFAKLVKAIGQHGDASTVAWLADFTLGVEDFKVTEARLYSLGNIRDAASVERLMGLMQTAGREKTDPFMGVFRMSLMRLTGADEGRSQQNWTRWWNEHKKGFEVAAEIPAMPKDLQLTWDSYWGTYRQPDRVKKRGDRGDDPEGGK